MPRKSVEIVMSARHAAVNLFEFFICSITTRMFSLTASEHLTRRARVLHGASPRRNGRSIQATSARPYTYVQVSGKSSHSPASWMKSSLSSSVTKVFMKLMTSLFS